MTDNTPPQLYGIWVPRQGWWMLPKPSGEPAAYTEIKYNIAAHYARLIGKGARVEPIDRQLEIGNNILLALEQEREENNLRSKLWHILKNFWHKANT